MTCCVLSPLMFTQEPGPPRGTVAALGACLFQAPPLPGSERGWAAGPQSWAPARGRLRDMTGCCMLAACGRQDAGMLAGWPGDPSGSLPSSLQAFSCLSCHGHMARRKLFAPGGRGGQQPPRSSSSGLGRDPKWRSPRGDQQRSQSQVSLTSSASGRGWEGSPQATLLLSPAPEPTRLSPQLSPAPSLTGASFWSQAPSHSRDAGRVSGPAGASPAPASWCLEPLPVVHQPPVPGGLCPWEGGSFLVSSQHILWPVPPILPPTAGAGPSPFQGS